MSQLALFFRPYYHNLFNHYAAFYNIMWSILINSPFSPEMNSREIRYRKLFNFLVKKSSNLIFRTWTLTKIFYLCFSGINQNMLYPKHDSEFSTNMWFFPAERMRLEAHTDRYWNYSYVPSLYCLFIFYWIRVNLHDVAF